MFFEYEEILEQQKMWLDDGFNPTINMRKGDDVTLQDKYYGVLCCAALLHHQDTAHQDADSPSSEPLTKLGSVVKVGGGWTHYENDSVLSALSGIFCDNECGANFTFTFDRYKLTKRGQHLIKQWSKRSADVTFTVYFPDGPEEAWIHIESF